MKNYIFHIVGTLVFIGAITLGGLYIKKDFFDLTSIISVATSSPQSVDLSGLLIEQVPITPSSPAPDLKRFVLYSSTLTPEFRKVLEVELKKVIANLSKDSSSSDDWLQYGNLLNSAGDHQGAIEVYNYVSLIRPGNIVSFGNAGDTYHYYLKDYTKAEINLKKVIVNDPTYALGYKNLFDLYHLSYNKDTTLAEDALKQGIARLPKDINLPATLASYYLEKGRKSDAITYYEKALANAKEAKDQNAVSLLEPEIAKLKTN